MTILFRVEQMQTKQNNIVKNFKIIVKLSIMVVLVALIVETFGYKGLIGYLIMVSLFGLYKLYQYRENFVETMRQVEIIMFGKPLEKDYWKNQKVKMKKFRWKK